MLSTRFVRFLLSGGTAAFIEYAAFLLLDWRLGKEWLVFSQSSSFLAGLLASFTLNRKWVFRSGGRADKQLTTYLILAGINLITSNFAMMVMVDSLAINQYLAKILIMGAIAGWNYFIFSTLVFKERSC